MNRFFKRDDYFWLFQTFEYKQNMWAWCVYRSCYVLVWSRSLQRMIEKILYSLLAWSSETVRDCWVCEVEFDAITRAFSLQHFQLFRWCMIMRLLKNYFTGDFYKRLGGTSHFQLIKQINFSFSGAGNHCLKREDAIWALFRFRMII